MVRSKVTLLCSDAAFRKKDNSNGLQQRDLVSVFVNFPLLELCLELLTALTVPKGVGGAAGDPLLRHRVSSCDLGAKEEPYNG